MLTLARLVLAFAILVFMAAIITRQRRFIFAGALILSTAMLTQISWGPPPAVVAAQERRNEAEIIHRAEQLAHEAQGIISEVPRTTEEAQRADGAAARFYHKEQAWLNSAEYGKPLDSFVDENASNAAIRIVAVDNFLMGAVQSAIFNCNDHDSLLNMSVADTIIADAAASLDGHGNPNFSAPDLTHRLNGSNNCINTTQ